MLNIFGLLLIVTSLHYTSPAHLTRALSDAMGSLEKVYTDLVCTQLMGLLTADDVAEAPHYYSSRSARSELKPSFTPFHGAQPYVVPQRPFIHLVPLHQRGEENGDTHQAISWKENHRRRFSSAAISDGSSGSHPTGTGAPSDPGGLET
ncbi:hypothetical protein C8F04DRAFT_1146637 [Mycena alexandri]|uniref:Uncharacterized protein n=1 Tax=Mycena alexandri TaxID=1745969 RepID=A0AAD6S2C9_9AGAR|nr:hypothetical protein C8F04DRAFT_1146637 [Mycena alexandri]